MEAASAEIGGLGWQWTWSWHSRLLKLQWAPWKARQGRNAGRATHFGSMTKTRSAISAELCYTGPVFHSAWSTFTAQTRSHLQKAQHLDKPRRERPTYTNFPATRRLRTQAPRHQGKSTAGTVSHGVRSLLSVTWSPFTQLGRDRATFRMAIRFQAIKEVSQKAQPLR